MSEPSSEQYTIDELARRTGLTTRNIRAYQSRGLVEKPIRRGRTGYYGEAHVERLELIRQLREEGMALDLIERMLEVAGDSRGGLSFVRTLVSQFGERPRGEPQSFSVAELAQIFQSADFTLVARAERDGLWRLRDDGRVEIVDRQLFEAGQLMVEMGVPANQMLEMLETMRDSTTAIALMFRDVFVKYVWEEFETAGRPDERWEEVTKLLERARAAADEATITLYRQAMDKMLSEELEQKLMQLDRPGGGA